MPILDLILIMFNYLRSRISHLIVVLLFAWTCSCEDGTNLSSFTIAFSTDDLSTNERDEIYLATEDGRELKRINPFDDESNLSPEWSPDGKQIVFVTSKRSTTLGLSIYMMNADGSNPRPMREIPLNGGGTLVSFGRSPRWSPDGTKIVYSSCIDCGGGGLNHEILVYNFDTDSSTNLTNHPFLERDPTWSYQSNQIVFVSDRDWHAGGRTVSYFTELYRMDDSGENQVRITDSENLQYLYPRFSPIEDVVAFYFWDSSIVSADVGLNRLSTSDVDVLTDYETVSFPAWSPFGDQIIVSGFSSAESTVLTVNTNGAVLRELSLNGSAPDHFTWRE